MEPRASSPVLSSAGRPASPAADGGRARGRVLVIAGSDSGGGAGVQADIKAITAMGGYAMTAITALTVQNSLGVFDVHPVPPAFIRAQMEAVVTDLGTDAIKTGMLASVAIVELVAEALDSLCPGKPAIVDPVMVAKGGAPLLETKAIAAMVTLMVPRAFLLTPNAPEAERLTGTAVSDVSGQRRAAERLLRAGARAVLVKGGHVGGSVITDVLATERGEMLFESKRIETRHTHGTGCTLASAIAAGIAQGTPLPDAVDDARAYLAEAIARAPGFGAGHGPLDHAWPMRGIRRDPAM